MSRDRDPRAFIAAGASSTTSAPAGDVEIDAHVSASELRVPERPQARTAVSGEGAAEREVSSRRNLPSRLEPGEVYRDIAIRRRVAGHLTGASPVRASNHPS